MRGFNPLEFVLRLAVFALAIVVHEYAHGWMADRRGDPTARQAGRLTLNPVAHIDPVGTVIVPLIMAFTGGFVFGWAKPVPVNAYYLRDPKRDMMWVTLAGPLANVAMAVGFALLIQIGYVAGAAFLIPLMRLLYYGVLINLVLAFFNLIPIPPLDGSHVLESVLPWPYSESYQRIAPYGMFILLGLMFIGFFGLYLGVTAGPLADLLTRRWF